MTPEVSTKRIVCLANSRKLGGCCIAGKELLPGGKPGPWFRPVSNREHEEVSLREIRCLDGAIPQVLEVLDVPVLQAKPKDYQQENWLLDPERRWSRVDTIDRNILSAWVDSVDALWHNGDSSSSGVNNRVPEDAANALRTSLCLIPVDNFDLHVSTYGGKKRIQGHFIYKSDEYNIAITDHEYEYVFGQKPIGIYPLGKCLLTVSLGEPFEGYAYKLIAAIIQL